MSKKRPSMADIQLDAGVVTLPGLQAPAGGASPKAGAGVGMEKFQVHIPAEVATELRIEAAKRKLSYSAVFLQAWALWKKNPPESY